MPGRLQGEDRVQLLLPVADIHPVLRTCALRNPVQAVQPHDVVDPQHRRVTCVVSHDRPHVRVAVIPDAFGMQRRGPPVLAQGEQSVRRSTDGHTGRVQRTMHPGVKALRMRPDRQIQVESG